MSGLTTVVTLELDNTYQVDAILIMGDWRPANHLSEFNLYVGNDSDYTNNVQCAGGPFAFPVDSDYGTWTESSTSWVNGVEAWCNLSGKYVSFVRESTASPALNDVVLCTFGVISSGPACSPPNSLTGSTIALPDYNYAPHSPEVRISLSSAFTSDPTVCFAQATVTGCSNTGPRTDLCSILTIETTTGDYVFSASAADVDIYPAGDYVTTVVVLVGGLTATSSFT